MSEVGTEQGTERQGDDFTSPSVNVVTETEAVSIKKGEAKAKPPAPPSKAIIRPIHGSRMMARMGNVLAHQIEGFDADGNPATEPLGTYVKERFADSMQNFVVEFDSDLGQFDIRKPNGALWTQEDANECLRKFPLTYEEGHPKANEPITSCDITNVADPYFIHKGLRRMATEGELELNPNSVRDQFLRQMYAGMAEVGVDNGEEFHPGDMRYLITNPEADEVKVEKKMNDALDASTLFVSIQDDRRKIMAILRMFGVDVDKDLSLQTLRPELFKYVNDNSTTDQGATYQQRFLMYVRMDDVELYMRENIALALNNGIITSRAGTYMFADYAIGRMYSQVVDYFKDGKNDSQYEDLKLRVEKYK